jgi:superfamily I DNA/RNA helicase
VAYTLSFREGFLSELLALQAREQAQINAKLQALLEDPRPDGVTKKQLKYLNRQVSRLRSGDFRVFYTFDDRFVSLLKVVRRSDDTYEDDVEAENFGGPDDSVFAEAETRPESAQRSSVLAATARSFPAPLDAELLNRLRVPTQYHAALMATKNEDELLACASVPDDVLLRVHTALFERPLEQAFREKELIATEPEDLLRYRDGDLMGFLLRLSPDQEKYVAWAAQGAGATLVKGGPGTGKSTVALYRVKVILEALKREGISQPRILFTTYTNALVTFSEQLLRSLLGEENAALVEVRTADSLAMSVVFARAGAGAARVATAQELRDAMQKALTTLRPAGSSLQKRAQVNPVTRLGVDYLIEEVSTVIEGRRLKSVEDYLASKRPGRRVPLNENQRRLVWDVREAFNRELKRLGKTTFQQIRTYAAQIVEEGHGPEKYDAVVVDEAQDLDPSLLWLLASLAREPNRIFLTADANQSIYGSGFRWSDVHEWLQFRGRTGILRANFRSTKEIGQAAAHYLADGALESDAAETEYVHSGPLPVIRVVPSTEEAASLLARFFREAAREFRLPLWAGALLVPTDRVGGSLAAELTRAGVPATFMTGRDLDLGAKAVKVITLKSAKGLEFPFVGIAGFEPPYPYVKPGMPEEEVQERVTQERRTLFVAMTRAMRALMLVKSASLDSALLANFDPALWNVAPAEQSAPR